MKQGHRVHRQSPEGRADHRDAERERRARQRRSVGEHTSEKLTTQAQVVPASKETCDEEESIQTTAPAASLRIILPTVPLRKRGNNAVSQDSWPIDGPTVVVEQRSRRVCIACGRGYGKVVRVMELHDIDDSRAPPRG